MVVRVDLAPARRRKECRFNYVLHFQGRKHLHLQIPDGIVRTTLFLCRISIIDPDPVYRLQLNRAFIYNDCALSQQMSSCIPAVGSGHT